MILYTLENEGDYLSFKGVSDTFTDGRTKSYRKTSVKRVKTIGDDFVLIIKLDNSVSEYNYKEVEDPNNPGSAFSDVDSFRDYLITNLDI